MTVNFQKLNREFASVIRDVDREVQTFVDAIDLNELCRYNAGYRTYAGQKFRGFVEHERNRFIFALKQVRERIAEGSVCDLGCFVPYLPLALAILGYRVKIVDKYGLYGEKLKASIEHLARKWSIQVFDLDILSDDFSALGTNEVVLLMAVVEHLNGSPRVLMEKTRGTLSQNGFLLFEVPNIAEFGRRVLSLFGRSILPDYAVYLDSAYPFTGHNREMTVSEVEYLFGATGYEVEQLFCYDYAVPLSNGWKGQLLRASKALAPMRNKHQVIRAIARPRR